MRRGSHPTRRRFEPRGVSLILLTVLLFVLIAFVSLAVDIGRLRLARAQLQTTADATARGGAWSLPKGVDQVLLDVDEVADRNEVIDNDDSGNSRTNPGHVLELDEDVFFGIWDPKKVNTGADPFKDLNDAKPDPRNNLDPRQSANAVRAWARRLEDRDNPVKLIFAPVVGTFSKDEERMATAYIVGEPLKDFGFVGIDGVYSNGTKATLNGGVISDGNIDLGNGDVNGNARPGINGFIKQGPESEITGWTANLDYSIKGPPEQYPIIPAPSGAVPMGEASSFELFGGLNAAGRGNFTWSMPKTGPINLIVNGYVRIFVTSDTLDLKRINVTFNNPTTLNPKTTPPRLEYYMASPTATTVESEGNRQIYCHIYAPQCDVLMNGTADFNGWAVGKTLTFKGIATYNYDGTNNAPGRPYELHLVE